MGALAVVAVGVAALVVVASQDEPSSGPEREAAAPSSTEQQTDGGDLQAWTAPPNDDDFGHVIRTVTVGDDLIIVSQRDATSIDRRTGEQNWYQNLEEDDEGGNRYVLCGASTAASDDGRTLAVTVGTDEQGQNNLNVICGFVGLMDLTTGEVGQLTQLAYEGSGGSVPEGMPIEIVGDTVIVTWSSTIFGLDLATLGERWRWLVETAHGMQGSLCNVEDMALGAAGHVVARSYCIDDFGDTYEYLDEVGVADGAAGRTYGITAADARMEEISSINLLAAEPVVLDIVPVVVPDNPEGVHSLVVLDDAWQVLNVIQDERTTETSDSGLTLNAVGSQANLTGPYRKARRTLFSGTTMVSFTPPNRESNELVAVDLTTGADLWRARSDLGFKFWQVLAVEDDSVAALAVDPAGVGQSVVTVDRVSGAVTEERVTEIPEVGDLAISVEVFGYVYADGRAYGVKIPQTQQLVDEEWSAFAVG